MAFGTVSYLRLLLVPLMISNFILGAPTSTIVSNGSAELTTSRSRAVESQIAVDSESKQHISDVENNEPDSELTTSVDQNGNWPTSEDSVPNIPQSHSRVEDQHDGNPLQNMTKPNFVENRKKSDDQFAESLVAEPGNTPTVNLLSVNDSQEIMKIMTDIQRKVELNGANCSTVIPTNATDLKGSSLDPKLSRSSSSYEPPNNPNLLPQSPSAYPWIASANENHVNSNTSVALSEQQGLVNLHPSTHGQIGPDTSVSCQCGSHATCADGPSGSMCICDALWTMINGDCVAHPLAIGLITASVLGCLIGLTASLALVILSRRGYRLRNREIYRIG